MGRSDEGFDASFPRLYQLAYRTGYRMLGERSEAEDVAQEAMARALVRWPALRERPEGWIVRVTANLAIDRWRRRRRQAAPRDAAAAVPNEMGERVDLARALRRLPRRQREVVVLRYLGDWSEQDVAAELGCTVGTVKSHGARGLASLRSTLTLPAEGVDDVRAP
jgi:RNA polymerase sigma-70 factor (sigma-E family)